MNRRYPWRYIPIRLRLAEAGELVGRDRQAAEAGNTNAAKNLGNLLEKLDRTPEVEA